MKGLTFNRMATYLKHVMFIVFFGCLCIACRKDGRRTNNPNDIIETEPAVQKPVTIKINDAVGGYYEALPFHYYETTKLYPLLVFIPGAGQFGNGAADLPYALNDGVALLLDKKKFPPSFNVNRKNFSLIVLTPQFAYYPSNADIASFIQYAREKYKVDRSRIYLAGLSMGGFVTSNFSAENTSVIAAAVPIAGVLMTGDLAARCNNIAAGKLPVWVFHNTDDPTINSAEPVQFVSMINHGNPAIPAKLTLFKQDVHDSWTQAINPSYRENNMNMYEWMLQYSK